MVGDPAFAQASDPGIARARLCTLVDDSIAIAALYRTLARRLTRNPWLNGDLDAVTRAIVVENKWRAQRYGVHGTFVGDNGAVTVAEMLEQVIEEPRPTRGARLPGRDCSAAAPSSAPAPRLTRRWRCSRRTARPRAARRAARGHRLDRGDDAAVTLALHPAAPSAPRGRGRGRRPRRARAARTG